MDYLRHLYNLEMHSGLCQKQSTEKGVLKTFVKFIGKNLCQSLFFNKKTWYRCFPVNFAKFLRTPF